MHSTHKGFAQLVILLIILIVFGIGVYAIKNQRPSLLYFEVSPAPSSTTMHEIKLNKETATSEIDVANWKTYTNPQKTFALMLPPNWELTSTLYDPHYRKFLFGGPEGTIQILYGSGLGGGCTTWSKIQIKTNNIDACYTIEDDQSELIGSSTIYQDQGFSISSRVNAPYQQNEKTVKDIFSTIELIGTEQF